MLIRLHSLSIFRDFRVRHQLNYVMKVKPLAAYSIVPNQLLFEGLSRYAYLVFGNKAWSVTNFSDTWKMEIENTGLKLDVRPKSNQMSEAAAVKTRQNLKKKIRQDGNMIRQPGFGSYGKQLKKNFIYHPKGISRDVGCL